MKSQSLDSGLFKYMADKVKASDRNPHRTKYTAGLHLLAALAVDMAKRPGM